jgi:hypothetical protein
MRLSQPLVSTPLSPTGALRARRQAEAAQQALSELSVLTEQLIELPERLRQAGLARQKGQQLQEAMEAFTELAALAWSGIAEGRLNDVAATPLYRQRAVAATRRVSRLQQETTTSRPVNPAEWDRAVQIELARARKRVGPLWRLRTQRYLEVLGIWRAALQTERAGTANGMVLGNALEDLRAAVGFAGMQTAQIIFFRVVVFIALVFGGLVAATAIGVAASTLTLGLWNTAATLTTVAVGLTLLWSYLLGLFLLGRISLRFVLGAVRWRLIESESHTSQGLLSGWNWVAALVAMLASIGTLGYAGWLLHFAFLPGGALHTVNSLTDALQHIVGTPLHIVTSAVGVTLALPLLVALPSLLIYQGMLGRELAQSGARAAQARQLTLNVAMPLLVFHTLLVLTVAVAVARSIPGLTQPLFTLHGVQLSWIAPIVAVVIIGLYLFVIVRPYRVGMRRWRAARLGALQGQMRDLTTKLDQLGAAPTMPEEASAVQYDVARLQYLRLQAQEVTQTRRAPFGAAEQFGAFLLVLITALLVDNGLAWAARSFIWR